jgi:hypothetical protein
MWNVVSTSARKLELNNRMLVIERKRLVQSHA